MEKAFDLVALGEVMLRLSPPGSERLVRGDVFEKRAGGSELNVASGVSLLGLRSGILTKLPKNPMGTFIKNRIRFVGVSDDWLLWDEEPGARLGLYYYENGVHPRKPGVVYDRVNSSFTRISMEEIDPMIFSQTKVFHTSGITLALGGQTKATALECIRRFKENGAKISFDVNYRANLWSEEDARKTIDTVLPLVDYLFVSEETSRRMFRKEGSLEDILKSFSHEYGISYVASTQRTVVSPKHHDFTSLLYSVEKDQFYSEKPYRGIDVVDRIGSGDAYCAGVLFGLLKLHDPQVAVSFGNAAASVKDTIPGDLPSSEYEEIASIVRGHSAEGPQEELNR